MISYFKAVGELMLKRKTSLLLKIKGDFIKLGSDVVYISLISKCGERQHAVWIRSEVIKNN